MALALLGLVLLAPFALFVAAATWNVEPLDEAVPIPLDLLIGALALSIPAWPATFVGVGLIVRYVARRFVWPQESDED